MNRFFASLRMVGLASVAVAGFMGRADAQMNNRVDTEFFENKIRPVLVDRCYKCHSEATQSKGGLKLDSREHLLHGGQSGAAAILDNPERSPIVRAIRKTDRELKMPPDAEDTLTPSQIRDFVAWIKMGLPYPSDGKSQSSRKPIDLAEARRFWSFQPVREVTPPKVEQIDWPQGPIDAFVLVRLERNKLKPSASADKRTLLRRAAYDLTGLPPTPESMEAFLADDSADAFAKVVDRLLASPQYGVKWGRHWLDVARYGDTRWVGAGEDRRWPFAYTYRDWVIGALNEDMPYDRFVTLQLAADQTPNTNAADKAALGFLTVGRWFTGTLPDVIDDQIDVVTRGLLGMSVQCARCHDHKYDPIPTKDYYSLYGLFAASRMPVEGTGLMAELPETSPPPIDAATEAELLELQNRIDRFLTQRLTEVRTEYRSPKKMEEYLLVAQSLIKKTDNDVRALAKTNGFNESILFRWVRFLQRTVKGSPNLFAPWHAFAELSEAEFSAKAAALAEREKSNKLLNRHVAAMLTPTPTSRAELARRYVGLLLKFDVPDPVSDADGESIRQAIQNNDSPVQVSLGELGSFLSADEKDQVVRMRRELLTKLAKLSESADHYLAYRHEVKPVREEVAEFLRTRRTAVAAAVRSPEKIIDYLMAAHDVQGADEYRFKTIVNSRKLSDKLLRRWVEFLQRRAERDDPVFAAWRAYGGLDDKVFAEKASATTAAIRKAARNRLVVEACDQAPTSLREVALRYATLIAKYNALMPVSDADAEAIRQVSVASDSPLCFESDAVLDYFTRKDFDELRGKENKLARIYLEHPGAAPRAMPLRELPGSYAQKVFVRGNTSVLGEDAPGRFLSVLCSEKQSPFHKGQGRLELAQSIVDPANPLTARVMVNRVWQWHFGTGLVRSPSDLGTRGEKPSHPELLDWLARRFMADGWSMKKLHRQIMLSSTYCQSRADNPANRAIDPENRLLWRANRRRLGFEEFRDSILAAAGRLDESLGGRAVDLTRPHAERRTVYGVVDRMNLPGFYRYFDFPGSDAHTPERHETIIPQQALYLMNNAFIMDEAHELARRTGSVTSSPADRIRALYRMVYGRAPSAEELSLGAAFTAAPEPGVGEPTLDPWRYGYGSYRERQGRSAVDFKPFPFFNGQWRAGPQVEETGLGRCSLHAQGGHAGPDGRLAVIRRWVSPHDGKISIRGILSCQPGSIQLSGDGVRGRIVGSRAGQLGVWLVHGTEEPTDVEGIEVRQGDTIDFIADGRGRDVSSGFNWVPVIKMDMSADKDVRSIWDAAKDFKGATPVEKRFGVWDRYAQVLLEANEFVFVD